MAEGNGSRDKQFTWLYRGVIAVLLLLANRYLDSMVDTMKDQGITIAAQAKSIAEIALKVGTHDTQITTILGNTQDLKNTMATGKAARDAQIRGIQDDELDLKIRMTKTEDRLAVLGDLVAGVKDSVVKLWAQINGRGHLGTPPP